MKFWLTFRWKYLWLIGPLLFQLFFVSDFIQYVAILSGAFFLYRLLSFVERFGREIIVIDIIELLIIAQWVLAPALYYCLYRYKLIHWEWYFWKMTADEHDYFNLAIPCTIATLIGLRWQSDKFKINYREIFSRIRLRKSENFKSGLILIFVGLFSKAIAPLIPDSMKFVSTLLEYFIYIGFLYIYFSGSKYRVYILTFLFVFIIYSALAEGMFGGAIWWPLFLLMIILFDRPISFKFKLTVIFIALVSFSVLQSVKMEYRQITWLGKGQGTQSNLSVLGTLLTEKISDNKFSVVSWQTFAPIIFRMNQGLHVCNVMRYTPSREPFAYGETIVAAVGATILPRLFWPNKPEAGGRAIYKRFTGYILVRASMNIGQIGEAYVNFTEYGAPIFLFVYGLMLNLFFRFCLSRVKQNPLMLFWIPFLFFNIINVESDFLTTLNAMFKTAVFLLVVLAIFRKYFL